MRRKTLYVVLGIAAAGVALVAFLRGPGRGAAEAVDRTADGLTGAQAVRSGKELEEDVRDAVSSHEAALRKTEGGAPGGSEGN